MNPKRLRLPLRDHEEIAAEILSVYRAAKQGQISPPNAAHLAAVLATLGSFYA